MNQPSPAEKLERDIVYPELVMCLCAAVGTDTGMVTDALSSELRNIGYTPEPIRLSHLMSELPGLECLQNIEEEDTRIRTGMRAGNAIRRQLRLNDAVVRLALIPIQEKREALHPDPDETVPAERHCFIISSLKRREELDTIRTLFGRRALLISIYEPREQRVENLCKKIAKSKKSTEPEGHLEISEKLIEIDQKERNDPFGQRLEDVFSLADVFLKADERLRDNVRRFVQLLFRAPYITPTIDEFLCFMLGKFPEVG